MNIENLPHLPAATPDEPAWEQRSEIGFFPALFQTVYSVLFFPKKTFSNLKTTGSIFSPLFFYLLLASTLFITRFLSQLPQVLNNPLLLGPHVAETYQRHPALALTGACFLQTLFFLISCTIIAFTSSALFHLGLKIIKSANKPFGATFRVLCYIHGALSVPVIFILTLMISMSTQHDLAIITEKTAKVVQLAIPFIGFCFIFIGLKNVHRLSTLKTLLSILTAFFLLIITGCIFILIISAKKYFYPIN
ncbi:MAG: YIP1 family protein [Chthoniobacterales bacterium]|nr:YIP1 family protein [Chthoniobacterales bacterium]